MNWNLSGPGEPSPASKLIIISSICYAGEGPLAPRSQVEQTSVWKKKMFTDLRHLHEGASLPMSIGKAHRHPWALK